MSREGQGGGEAVRPLAVTYYRLPSNTAVVQVGGDVIGVAADELQRAVYEELTGSPAHVIIDISDVSRIDRRAIDVLASAAAIAGEADISLGLVDLGGNPVRDALAAANMTELFEVFETVDDAVQASRRPRQD